jgi:hypothetical protein
MTGEWPEDEVDHHDLNKSNNAWDNLREATRSQNSRNTRGHRDSKTGVKGVHLSPSGKYTAAICINRVQIHLGTFDTIEAAAAQYAEAANVAFDDFARAA